MWTIRNDTTFKLVPSRKLRRRNRFAARVGRHYFSGEEKQHGRKNVCVRRQWLRVFISNIDIPVRLEQNVELGNQVCKICLDRRLRDQANRQGSWTKSRFHRRWAVRSLHTLKTVAENIWDECRRRLYTDKIICCKFKRIHGVLMTEISKLYASLSIGATK